MRASLEKCYNDIPEPAAEQRFPFLPWTHREMSREDSLFLKKAYLQFSSLASYRCRRQNRLPHEWTSKWTGCQSDQAISVQTEEDYCKIHNLTCWQKSLLSSINTRWLAGYFGCFTSPNFFFFSPDYKRWTTFFLRHQHRVFGGFWYDS